ncbi:unnamed protein product [Sphagnum compactum]
MWSIMGFGAECQQHNVTWQLEINKTLWQASPIIPARAKTIVKVLNHAHTLRSSQKRSQNPGIPTNQIVFGHPVGKTFHVFEIFMKEPAI